MKVSSYSASSSSGSKTPKTVLCFHKYKAEFKTIGIGPNIGKNFWGCPLWPNGCGFFLLEEDLQNGCGFFLLEEDLQVGDDWKVSDYELKRLDDKLKKLKLKKEMLNIEVKYLKDELVRRSNGQKMLMYALISSWIIFFVSWIVKL